MAVSLFSGADHNHRHVTADGMGNEVLAAVNSPSVAVANRGSVHASCIASRAGLGKSPSANPLTARELRKPATLLLLGSELVNMLGAQGIVGGNAQANAAADLRNFVDNSNVLRVAHAGTTVFRADEHTQKSKAAHFVKKFLGEDLGLVPFHNMGGNMLRSKFGSRGSY